MQIVFDILVNLVSDLLAWIIVAAILSWIAWSGTAQYRRQLFEFFGLSSSRPKVQVYISRFEVKPGGATMIRGEEWPTFEGPVVSAREFIVLPELDRLFRSPFLDNLPHSAREWLSKKYYSLRNIEVNFQPSPRLESEISGETVILLGDRLVNVGTRYYQDDTSSSLVEFDNEKHQLVIARGHLKGESIQASGEMMAIKGGERPNKDLAVIQRLYDDERKRTVIISAGMGTNGTMAATIYLVRHWRELYERFGRYDKKDFAIVIECPNRRTADNGYLFPIKRGEFTV